MMTREEYEEYRRKSRRSHSLSVAVSPEEFDILKNVCKDRQISLSDYVRAALYTQLKVDGYGKDINNTVNGFGLTYSFGGNCIFNKED